MAVEIRCWQDRDCADLVLNANNPHVANVLREGFPSPYTEEDAAFFINLANRTTEDRAWLYAIALDGKAVGSISLTFGDDVYARKAELGYWLGEPYWGQGITTEAVRQICEKAFRETEIVRIEAEVLAINPGSIRVLEKNQFIREGYFCQRVSKMGKLLDTITFACFR